VSFLSEIFITDTMAEVIDATTWPEITGLLPPGTRDKVWIYDPGTGRRALFKQPKPGTCEHVCEKLTTVIAAALGLAVPEVAYARRGEFLGSVIHSFLGDGERLVHGGEVFAGLFDGFDPWDYKAQTYQRIRKVMILPAIGLRVHEMILLDALVGNVDRHVNNWGFVSNSFQYFAPFFDNGSSLIARCDGDKCGHLLRDQMQFDGLVRNCESRIYWQEGDRSLKLRHFDFVGRLKIEFPRDLRAVEGRFRDAAPSTLVDCLDDVPDGWLTPAQREVAATLIRTRHQRLIEVLAA
jgi:HipA-like C-terminal domain